MNPVVYWCPICRNQFYGIPSAAPGRSKSTTTGRLSQNLLTPTDHILILTDHQPQMVFSVQSHDIADLRNNIAGLAKTAKLFNIPTILTTIAAATFSGKILPEIQSVFPDQKPIDRTTMNSWDYPRVVREIKEYGKRKIVIAGLWTEVCLLEPVLSAISDGYEVYFVSDASGGVTKESHDMAVIRMTQAGAHPITWLQYLLELQRDWALKETYNGTLDIVRQHGGAYGLGVIYANEMFGTFT
ncbi:hydrolase [Neobacillus sp. NPDC093127]|uniref:hydrolase n=1 Tax=Neobacillus sp. NPDC093127 TaxID=3364296 RepID=UPI0038201FDA